MARDLTWVRSRGSGRCCGSRGTARVAAAPRRQPRIGRFIWPRSSGAVLLFLCVPIAVVVPMSFSSAKSLAFPPPGLSLRWYKTFFGD